MAVHVHIPRENNKNVDVHHIPCVIKSDGEANVSKYFKPSIETSEDGVLKTSLRGRPLHGKEMKVPDGYVGFVLQETQEPSNEDEERNVYACASFDKITYWNYDQPPSLNDKILSIQDWIDISNAIHAPIDY